MELKLQRNYYYHYFGNELFVIGSNENYLLNEYQTLLIEVINNDGHLRNLVHHFLDVVLDVEEA
ncbi:hypothetical protein [Streptococcus sciuri]|uniref:Uncharacterized protein n=1 Tax=Streptococcus sciuri TaxID=2973939 RepID=A0ABT2F4L2_9STRE|nr:hypothetical protein [Streptococcus sciuri]MCS4487414.1 hypothetical protein [Streptococcus sciuri]